MYLKRIYFLSASSVPPKQKLYLLMINILCAVNLIHSTIKNSVFDDWVRDHPYITSYILEVCMNPLLSSTVFLSHMECSIIT